VTHFEANVMPPCSLSIEHKLCPHRVFPLRMAGAHPGSVDPLLVWALALYEWITQLISALDFVVVQLDLWEVSGLIQRMFNKIQKREESRTKTPKLSPNHAK